MTLLIRSFDSELETNGRVIEGFAYRYNVPSRVSDGGPAYMEAFTAMTAQGVSKAALHYMHPFQPGSKSDPTPFGLVEFSDGGEGLAFRATVSNTQKGNDFLTLLNDGVLNTSVSIGFKALKSRNAGGVTYRDSIEVVELSLLPAHIPGAHSGAEILAVREGTATPILDAIVRKERMRQLVKKPIS